MEIKYKSIGRILAVIHNQAEMALGNLHVILEETDGQPKNELQKEIWFTLYRCHNVLECILMTLSILYTSKLKGPQDDFDRKFLYEEKCRGIYTWADAFYNKPSVPGDYILVKRTDEAKLVLRRNHTNIFNDVDKPGICFWCYTPQFYEPPVLDEYKNMPF